MDKKDWNKRIEELETFFSSKELKPLRLYPHIAIIDPDLFVKSSLEVVKWNNGKKIFEPTLLKLELYQQILLQIL